MGKTKYNTISKFLGYSRKADETNLKPGYLVQGSQNVVMNVGERVASRKGYTIYGQANTALTPIISSYDWIRFDGTERNLRSYQDELEYRYTAANGTVTWRRLANGFGASVDFNFAEYWDTTRLIDRLLMVNGSSNIYDWSGGITTFASATVNTITKEGTTTWEQEGFYNSGTRSVVINGTSYTYTGGETTTTITGVAPDPTVAGHAVGSIIHQALRTTANSAMTAIPAALANSLIAVLNNQVFIGSLVNRRVYVSKVNDFTNYTVSSPRVPGEGALLSLDGNPIAFIPQDSSMYIAASPNRWYYTIRELGDAQLVEDFRVQLAKTTSLAAPKSQAAVTKINNMIVYLSQEPTLTSFGPLELIQTNQQVNISDFVKLDFDDFDFTNASVFYYRQNIYVSVPVEGVVMIYNMSGRRLDDTPQSGGVATGTYQKYWEAPQILPIRRFAVIAGNLYGHSSGVPETYKLFDGYNDNGNPIEAIATFCYRNFGDRINNKNFVEYYSEGYITSNTSLSLKLRYDYKGCAGTQNYTIAGDDTQIVCDTTGDGSLGKQALGKRSFGGRAVTISDTLPPKFRVIKQTQKIDFREMQEEYSTNQVDGRFELISMGPAAQMSTSTNADISQ